MLGGPVDDQAAPAGLKALGAIAGHRLGVCLSLALELLLGLAKPGAATIRGAKPLGSLVAPGITVELVLGASIRPASARISAAICS
jgi:hypothetical protein